MIDGYGDNRRTVCPACLGESRSRKKKAAARENGKRGGRPSKKTLAEREALRRAAEERKKRRKLENRRRAKIRRYENWERLQRLYPGASREFLEDRWHGLFGAADPPLG